MSNSFKAYNSSGARSNKKLIPIHSWIGSVIENKLGQGYNIKSLGHDGEALINGKYYPKRADITVFTKKRPIVTISFKFVSSNYAQNSNNYFENLLGETANIRRVGVGFAYFLVLRAHTPYFDKAAGNKRGKQTRTEVLEESHVKKYVNLFKDTDFPHKPDVLGIIILDFNSNGKAYFANLKKLELDPNTKETVETEFCLDKFFVRVVALCNLKK